jgi:ATP-dependent RNA helicase DDX3X
MSAWGTGEMAAALPDATAEQAAVEQTPDAPAAEKKNPQEYGWVATTKYDYATYNKSTKELAEAQASTEGVEGQE